MMNRQSKPYAEWGRADVEDFLKQSSSKARVARLRALPHWANRLRAVPGIVVAGGATGPRARIAGTGVDVFEVIQDYLDLGRSPDKLAAVYDWLTSEQLQTAITYFETFPDEILDRIALEEAFARAFDPART